MRPSARWAWRTGYNPNHAENPGKVCPTYEISNLEELYALVMEPEELANVGVKNRRHQL